MPGVIARFSRPRSEHQEIVPATTIVEATRIQYYRTTGAPSITTQRIRSRFHLSRPTQPDASRLSRRATPQFLGTRRMISAARFLGGYAADLATAKVLARSALRHNVHEAVSVNEKATNYEHTRAEERERWLGHIKLFLHSNCCCCGYVCYYEPMHAMVPPVIGPVLVGCASVSGRFHPGGSCPTIPLLASCACIPCWGLRSCLILTYLLAI